VGITLVHIKGRSYCTVTFDGYRGVYMRSISSCRYCQQTYICIYHFVDIYGLLYAM